MIRRSYKPFTQTNRTAKLKKEKKKEKNKKERKEVEQKYRISSLNYIIVYSASCYR